MTLKYAFPFFRYFVYFDASTLNAGTSLERVFLSG